MPAPLRPKQLPQSTQRYLHRGAARTTTGRVHMGLVGSSYEINSDDEGMFRIGTPEPVAGLSEVGSRRLAYSRSSFIGCRNQL